MEVVQTGLEGLLILQPRVFEDPRGYFFESYNKELLASKGLIKDFVQDNESFSQKGVLRGLHFQRPPHAQAKLVRVIKGAVQDVAVDIRKGSATFGKYYSIILTEKNKTAFYIPEGFAHGFLTLEDNTIFQYKCSNFYHKASEDGLLWNDPDIGIKWELSIEPLLSDKDKIANKFSDYSSPF